MEELTEAIEANREAIKIAQGRDRAVEQTRIYKEVKASALARHQELLELAGAIEAFGRAFNAVSMGLQALSAQTTSAGVPPELYEHPHLMYRRMVELVEHAMCLDTKGAIGKIRTLNGPEQRAMGVTGRSVVQHTAGEFLTLTLRRLQVALHLKREPE